MKILLTAPKKTGKSTVLEKFISLYLGTKIGFITTRMYDRNFSNQGFLVNTFDGRAEILSHKKFISSDIIVGNNNKVDLDVIDYFLVPELKKYKDKDALVIIDEIGRMESYSEKFLEIVTEILNSNCDVLGTITYENEEWCKAFKNITDVMIKEVTLENRNSLPQTLLEYFNNS